MKEFLRDALGVGVALLLMYFRLRRDYRHDRLNMAPRVEIQTLFGSYEETDDYRK
ncbi:MAG TPA: hypothetical protein VFP40_17860 [Terriglobales bacterium]|nr:hypothetical protein [Terriglobales bacterium]